MDEGMYFHVLTLFPEMIRDGLNTSILSRAARKGLIHIDAVNIRDYTSNRHGKVDDYIYGGGAGLLMQAQPVYDAWQAVEDGIESRRAGAASAAWKDGQRVQSPAGTEGAAMDTAREDCAAGKAHPAAGRGVRRTRVVYLTPAGHTFDQRMAREFAREEDLILLCGHYEGIDERVVEEIATDCVSIGDYVLTGGEIPAMAVIDAVSRLIPGVLGNETSADTDSFQNGLLEYPQYSRPEEWNGRRVPAVLLSGDHARVDAWRLEQSLARTRRIRPDLYEAWLAAHPEYHASPPDPAADAGGEW